MMKSVRTLFTLTLISFVLFGFSQTMNEAGEAFNQGINAAKEKNYTAAIEAYQNTISICDQLGDEGADLKSKAEQQIATSYYNYGKEMYTAKKYSDAIKNFKIAAEKAGVIGDTKTQNAANKYLAGITYAMGNSALKKEEYEKALKKYNEALSYQADYFKSYYGMGLVYKKQENYEMMKQSFDKFFEMAPPDDKTVAKATSVGASTFFNAGAIALQNGKNTDAIAFLNSSLEYEQNPTAYYYIALASNNLSMWDEAIAAANKALELGVESRENSFFELGKAYEGKGDIQSACDAYKNVSVGDNVAVAKHKIAEVLKCN